MARPKLPRHKDPKRKEYMRQYANKRYHDRGEAARAYNREWWFNNRLFKRYGLTVQEYGQLSEAQGGACAICGRIPEAGKRLSVDHNHRTGQVRALLCNACNLGLGNFGDVPELLELAASYLRKHDG